MSDLPAATPGRGSVARNAFYLTLGQATTTVLAIALSAALGRSLGAEDFGRYYLINTMAVLAYVIIEWGQTYYVVREAALAPRDSGHLLGSTLGLRIGFTLFATVPAGLIGWALGYGRNTNWLAIALIVALLPQFLAQAYGMVFRAHDQMGKDATVSVINKTAALCLALPFLAAGVGIPGVILSLGIAGTMALVIAARMYQRLGLPRLRMTAAIARQIAAAGSPIVAMSAAVSVQPYLDALILSKLVPAAVVGWFGASRGILGTLIAPATILGSAAYPQLARASGDPVEMGRAVRAALRPLLWLAGLAATGTYLFASTAISLIYGRGGFDGAATVLQVFAPGLFLLFIDMLLCTVIYASGARTTAFVVGKILSVVVSSALDVALIPWFQTHYANGGIGVVVAFALSEIVVFVGAMLALPKGTITGAALQDVLRAVAAGAMTIGLVRLAPALTPWVGIPLCIASFTAATFGLGLIGRRDLFALRDAIRSRH